MILLINVFIFSNIFTIVTQSEISRRQNKLLIFKKDMNKIGDDLENFIFDIAKEVVRKTDGFIEPDYGTEDYENSASEEEIISSKHSDQSNQVNKTYTKNNNEKEHLTSKVNAISVDLDRKNSSKIRHKRSTNDDAPEIFDNSMEEKFLGETSNVQNSHCDNNLQHDLSERKHIEDLREEVKKLYELVVLLRDQQKILSQLNNASENSSSDIPKRFESKELLKVLEHLNNNDIMDKPGLEESSFKKTPADSLNIDKIVPTHGELEKFEYDFKQAILALNQTRSILIHQQNTELALKKELQHQKLELNLLKIMVEKLIQNANFTSVLLSDKKVEDISNPQIVGIPLHLPKNMPTLTKKSETRENKKNYQMRKSPDAVQKLPNTRASELEDISQLFNEIDKPNLSDIELKIMDLQENIEKKKKEENLKKQLIILQKLMDKQQNSANSNSLQSDDSEASKKMQLLLKIITRPQKKSDDDIEDELKNLQVAIDKLRTKGEFDSLDISGDEKAELKQILNGKGQLGGATKGQQSQITPQEVFELKKKLDQLTSNGMKKVNMNQNIDFRGGPPPYPFWPEYNSNFVKVSPPYNNFPYPLNYNGYGYDGSFSYNYPINNKPQRYMQNYNPYMPFPFYQPNPSVDNNGKHYEVVRTEKEYSKLPFIQTQSDSPNERNKHLFLAPQPQQNFYYRPDTNHISFSEDIKGGSSEQPDPYLPENAQFGNYRTKSIEDLKIQINSLQTIINDLYNPGLTKRPEDQQLIGNLEQEINELKNIVNNLNADTPPISGNVPPPSYNQPKIPVSQDSSEHRLSKRFVGTDERLSNSKLFDEISGKLKSYFFDNKQTVADTHGEIENQVETFKKELDEQLKRTQRSYSPSVTSHIPNYHQLNFPYNYPSYSKILTNDIANKIHRKKDDISTSIVLKIFDKIIIALPAIIERLFGQVFYGLINLNPQNSYNSDYDLMYDGVNDIRNVFYNFGLVGYIPLILLKIINVLDIFVNILKKNKFLRNFLLPILVLLLVSASVLFLIWWLQPDGSNYKQIGYEHRQDYNVEGNYNDHGNHDRLGGNTELYSRNHGNTNSFYRRDTYMPMSYWRSYYENGQNINNKNYYS